MVASPEPVNTLIAHLEATQPQVVELAHYLSLAVQIESALLRRIRRTFLPGSEPGLEADLWFSPLVQVRTSRFIILRPDIIARLRQNLLALQDRQSILERIYRVQRSLHYTLPPALKLEEQVIYLALSQAPNAKEQIEQLLQSVIVAMTRTSQAQSLASWVARTLPTLPSLARTSDAIPVLALGASAYLGNRHILDIPFPSQAVRGWLPRILPDSLPSIQIGVRLLSGAIEFGEPSMDGAHTLSIPQTNPLLLEVESESRTEQIRLYPRQNHHVTVGSGQITLRTLLGESYQIFPASKIKRRSDKRSRPENDDATARTAPVEKGLFAVFDIDTDFVRAMIVEVRNQQAEILGMGYHPQNSAHMSEGVITDIPAVIANCHEALLKAEHDADNVMASSVIFSVSGASVKGSSTTVSKQRANPTKPITAEELELLITAAQERLIKAIKEQLSAETGYTNTDIRLTNAAVTSVAIDGQHLFNPIGFRGRHFTLTLFSAFAPLAQLQAFETIAQGLDLTLVTIVTRPYALARCLGMNDQGNGSIIIDIGVDMTSITLLRNGGIEDTRIFAFGLRTFARRIATSRGLPFEEAEHLINAYCNGAMSDTDRTEIQQFLIPDCQTWMDSVELLLEELAKGELLPSTIYMIGEGATMPDLYHHLETFPWTGRLPFSRSPMIREASPHLIPNILDPKGKITSKQDLTLIALAYQAIELTEENNALERALDRVINTLEI